MSKKIRDETIIEALLISATVRSAAAKLEINEQTIYRRKRDAEFMQKYNEARRERTEAARNVLQERAHAAADTPGNDHAGCRRARTDPRECRGRDFTADGEVHGDHRHHAAA